MDVDPDVDPALIASTRGFLDPAEGMALHEAALETVFCDYTAWAGHLMPGGMLLIHDIFPDPADGGQAPWHVYRMALASGLFEARPLGWAASAACAAAPAARCRRTWPPWWRACKKKAPAQQF
jgi:hypothetical protein